MEKKEAPKKKKRGLRLLVMAAVAAAALALAYSLLGFLVLPRIVRPMIEKKASEALDRKVSLAGLSVNPWTLSVTLAGLAVKDKDGADFVRAAGIYANFEAWSLPSLSVRMKHVALTEPYVRVVRNLDGTYNFSDIVKRLGSRKKPKPAKEPKKPFPLNLALLDVKKASLLLQDRVKGIDHKVKDASFSISEFSTLLRNKDRNVLFYLAFLADGARVAVKATSRPFASDQDARLEISVSGFNLPPYMAYAPLPPDVKVTSARLALKTDIVYHAGGKDGDLVLSGRLTLSDLTAQEGAGQALASIGSVIVDLAPTHILAHELHVSSIRVVGPELHVRRDELGKTNLEKLLASAKKTPAKAQAAPAVKTEGGGKAGQAPGAAPPFKFAVDRVRVESGRVFFTDQSTSPGFSATISPFSLALDNLSNQPGKKSDFSLYLATAAKESIKASGQLGLVPLGLAGRVSVSSIPLKRYYPYYSRYLKAEPIEGTVGVSAAFSADLAGLEPGRAPKVVVKDLALLADDLSVRGRGAREPVVRIPRFSLSVAEADLATRTVTVSELATERGAIRLELEKDGKLSLLSLLPPAKPGRAKAPAPSAPAASQPPWTVQVERVRLDGYQVDFTDKTPKTPARVRLSDIAFSAAGLSTKKGAEARMDLSARVQQRGSVRLSGKAGFQPLSAALEVSAKDLDLRTSEPYWRDLVGVEVTKGRVETRGRLVVGTDRATGRPRFNFSGDAAVLDFASSDKKMREDFFNFASLRFVRIKAGTSPLAVSVDKVGLDTFYSRIIIHPDGSVNLADVLPPKAPAGPQAAGVQARGAAPAATRTARPPDIRIKEIVLSRGHFNFTDNLIKPNYSADYMDMTGSMTGLSTDENSRAIVYLSGQLGNSAPVSVKGEIAPMLPKAYADLEVKVSGLELPTFSPYSGRFLGRLIEKGKLSLTLSYKIRQSQLAGANKVVLDQLTLGDKVESKDATSLPVGLAIALLKDRNGVIDLDLAVSGDMDDPKFSITGIIFKVIVNLVTKIVTSPFTLLGSLFGGGEDLQFADFAAGLSDISKETAKKLDSLEKALYERPGLSLEIKGDADPAADVEALRAIEFENMLKRQMLKKPDAEAAALKDVVIPPDQYQAVLKLAFEAADFPKPLDKAGKPREVTPQEMEQLLRNHVRITDGQLRILALARAQAAKAYILGKGRVEPGRVFILEPEPMTKTQDRKARAIFGIR